MYRITKVLNHNTVLAVKDKSAREYLIVGKGVGFGKKITQSVEPTEEDSLYELTQTRDRGPAKDIVKSIEPEYLEIANTLLDNAEHEFGHIDRSILFPMADHIAFAVKRMENKEQISNPLNDDIRVMFYREYKIAENIRHILKDKKQIDIIDDEIGYITLHIHTSLNNSKVSDAMEMAAAVRKCATFIEKKIGKHIDGDVVIGQQRAHAWNIVANPGNELTCLQPYCVWGVDDDTASGAVCQTERHRGAIAA